MNFRLNDEKMFMDIADGVAVVINSETGIYFGMNVFGTSVFEALTEGMDTNRISTALKELAGAPADMEERCEKFIRQLTDFEILVPGTESVEVAFDAALAAEDKFELEVTAYDDAQEMLLADPIHEVKEEVGWTPEKDSIGYTKEETRERERKIK